MDLIPGLPYDVSVECHIRIPHQYLSSAASVCRSWSRQIHLPEFWRRRKDSGFTRKLVVMVECRVLPNPEKIGPAPVVSLTLCEPETGFWSKLPPVPDGLPMHCRVAVAGLNLVVMGGWDPVTWEVTRCVFVYNLVSATWRRVADMPGCERILFACASDSVRKVFVAGGHDNCKNALKSAMAYDVVKDEWTMLPDMTSERDECKGVYYSGEFHVIGGYPTDMQGNFVKSAESFDTATWQWGLVREDFLETGECARNCVEDGDGKLVVMCRGVDVMERRGSMWSVVAKLPPNIKNVAFVAAWQGKVLVVGSKSFDAPYNKTFSILDLKSCKWEGVNGGEDFSGNVQSGCCLEL